MCVCQVGNCIIAVMGYEEVVIRSYDAQIDRAGVEDLERRCEVGPADRVFLFTDTMGDPICRIRNSPIYNMLVAEIGKELVGVIQGSIKLVTFHKPTMDNLATVGYILGLRVVPIYRRKGIGLRLVRKLEEWFISNDVDYAYMATEKDNEASVRLFMDKLGYVKFRTPAILVNPVKHRMLFHLPSTVEIAKLNVDEAEYLYRRFMGSTEFFPADINEILRNKLSLGTWVAYPKNDHHRSWYCDDHFGSNGLPDNWAMVSVWNSGEVFKLRLGKAPLSCLLYTKSSRLMDKYLPCLKLPALPDFYDPFGFYFMYGVYWEGPSGSKLVRSLCQVVHNMATKSKDCKVIVTEVGGSDRVRVHIPHWKLLSCPEDLWCIKSMKKNQDFTKITITPQGSGGLFVDPREV